MLLKGDLWFYKTYVHSHGTDHGNDPCWSDRRSIGQAMGLSLEAAASLSSRVVLCPCGAARDHHLRHDGSSICQQVLEHVLRVRGVPGKGPRGASWRCLPGVQTGVAGLWRICRGGGPVQGATAQAISGSGTSLRGCPCHAFFKQAAPGSCSGPLSGSHEPLDLAVPPGRTAGGPLAHQEEAQKGAAKTEDPEGCRVRRWFCALKEDRVADPGGSVEGGPTLGSGRARDLLASDQSRRLESTVNAGWQRAGSFRSRRLLWGRVWNGRVW